MTTPVFNAKQLRGERRARIVAFIASNPGTRAIDVARELNISQDLAKSAITWLLGEGLLKAERKMSARSRRFHQHLTVPALDSSDRPAPTPPSEQTRSSSAGSCA